MARPTKNVKRQEKLTLYYTKAEMRIIRKLALEHGVSMAVYARAKSLGHTLKPRLTEEEIHLYRQLAGMANNLNQLAHAANVGEVFTSKILNALEAINYTVNKLR